MGYGLVLISHATDKIFQNEDGTEYNKIVPTLPNKARLVVSRMCDIIGYSRIVETENGSTTMLFMRGTPRFEAGSRFKHTPDRIEFNYTNLVEAISNAIEQQAEEDGHEYVTDVRENLYAEQSISVDFDELMSEFSNLTKQYIDSNAAYYAPRITEIVDKHLGKGKRVSECTRDQAMLVDIILSELKEIKESK
jgi:hypothetical protein